MTGRLEGRVAIVTGAGGGIGKEHALLLAREGAAVVVNDLGSRTGADASTVVEEIRARPEGRPPPARPRPPGTAPPTWWPRRSTPTAGSTSW